jgi:hypothetical protein
MASNFSRGQLKCDGTRAETRFRLSAKRTSPFKSAGASVQSTTGSRGVRISGNNAGYTMFRGSVKGTGYPLHSPVSPSPPLPCVTVCHHVSTGLYHLYEFTDLLACPYNHSFHAVRASVYQRDGGHWEAVRCLCVPNTKYQQAFCRPLTAWILIITQ